jgi:MFS transporter, DHA1 family, inner membrane transport protein
MLALPSLEGLGEATFSMTTKERIILGLLSALNFTHILDFMIMMPLGAYLMPYFQISPLQFSLLVSAYTISAGVSGFAAAFFVDNYDRKKILIAAYALFLLGTIACGLAPNYYLLFAARVFAGIFGGLIGAQVTSIIADTFSYEVRGRAMGAVMSAFSLASTLGMPFALYLANKISWHAPFLLVGMLGIVMLPLLYRYLPSMTGHIQMTDNQSGRKMNILKEIISHPVQYQALIFTFLMMGGHFLVIPFINPFMQYNVGYSKEFTPWIYFIGGVASFISAHLLGRLADKYGKLSIYTISVLAALPMVYILTNLPVQPSQIAVLTLFALWFTVSTGRGVAGSAMVSNVVSPEHRGSFQSFNSSFQQLGTGIASFVTGLIVTKDATTQRLLHYDWAGYLSIVVLFFSLLLARKIFKETDIVIKKL